MKCYSIVVRLLCVLFVLSSTVSMAAEALPSLSTGDWPQWRGRSGDGIAAAQPTPPTHWSESENVRWKVKVSGRGHGSPTVVGDRVFLATADVPEQVQSVLCFDRATGRELWKVDVHRGGFELKGHQKSSQASSTVACDGERLYINFVNQGGVLTTALDLNGKHIWQTRISDFVTHQGFGSSPIIYESLVLVASDNKAGGAVAGLDRLTGKIVWRHERPKQPNYTSPAVLTAAGREQLVLCGCDHVLSLDPRSGKQLWEIEGSTTECVGSIVTDGQLVFASGGYPKKLTVAVLADGSGKVAWQNNIQTYVPSMLAHQGLLFTVTDAGIAYCWRSSTGDELWKSRLGGTFNSSPVLVGNLIYATNQEGKTFIFEARPDEYRQVAENQLGDDIYATSAVCGGQIYMRVASKSDGQRQERLYCIGSTKK